MEIRGTIGASCLCGLLAVDEACFFVTQKTIKYHPQTGIDLMWEGTGVREPGEPGRMWDVRAGLPIRVGRAIYVRICAQLFLL